MKKFGSAVILALTATHTCAGVASATNLVTMPVEVLSNGNWASPVVAPVSLSLSAADLDNASEIYVVCSRCGRYGAPEFMATFLPIPANTASMRLDGGASTASRAGIPWMDITDANVALPIEERLAGGVNGGFYTIHMTIPITAQMRARLVAAPALNTVEFQFNGSDGTSNGFRILDVAFRDAQHRRLGPNTVVQVDPLTERQAGATYTAAADAGRALWTDAHLLKSKVTHVSINATCGSCHANRGQDLQYFNYSNDAISKRAQFHGLSLDQANQVVAYIRYENRNMPYASKARPYNPPYQPGPGLDAQDVSQWAAGAGLDAVLTSANDSATALFGKDPSKLTQADVDSVMSANATLNNRQVAIPLQLPDWNAWLPSIAPEDVWPTTGGVPEGSFLMGATFSNGLQDPWGKYVGMINRLTGLESIVGAAHDWSKLKPGDRYAVSFQLYWMGVNVYSFIGGQRGNHIQGGTDGRWGAEAGATHLESIAAAEHKGAGMTGAFSHAAFVERAVSSLLQWNIVKQWELAKDFGLEGDQSQLIGDVVNGAWKGRGESRGFMFNAVGPFYVAPHMMYQKEVMPDGKLREGRFAWETSIPASVYRTNAWYQLQTVTNPGAQSRFLNLTVDWPYAFDFDQQVVDELLADGAPDAAAAQAVRLLQAHIKAAQYVNNNISINDPTQPDLFANTGYGSKAMAAKHLTPAYYVDYHDPAQPVNRFRLLDSISSGLYLKAVSGTVNEFNQLYAGVDVASWRRCAAPGVQTQFGTDEAASGSSYCLDAAPRALPVDRLGNTYLPWYTRTLYQSSVWGYASAKAMGIEPVRMAVWLDWIQRAYPGYALPTVNQK